MLSSAFSLLLSGALLSLPLVVLGVIELVLAARRQWPQETRVD